MPSLKPTMTLARLEASRRSAQAPTGSCIRECEAQSEVNSLWHGGRSKTVGLLGGVGFHGPVGRARPMARGTTIPAQLQLLATHWAALVRAAIFEMNFVRKKPCGRSQEVV